AALAHLRAPQPGWLAAALAEELASMGMYARMQRRLLHAAGVRSSLPQHVALAYAAHSLSVTLPGGPAFSTAFNYRQMRRFGASPAVASWAIALSAAALAVITAAAALAAHDRLNWPTLLTVTSCAVLVAAGVRLLTRRPHIALSAGRAALAVVNRVRRRPAADGLEA
ncbi:UPF0104 family protein, partial [Nonomuraea insulae]